MIDLVLSFAEASRKRCGGKQRAVSCTFYLVLREPGDRFFDRGGLVPPATAGEPAGSQVREGL